MIHSAVARPTVANIVFCCFVFLNLKSGEGRGRAYGRTTCVKTMIPTGRDFGLAEWIKKTDLKVVKSLQFFHFKLTQWLFNGFSLVP